MLLFILDSLAKKGKLNLKDNTIESFDLVINTLKSSLEDNGLKVKQEHYIGTNDIVKTCLNQLYNRYTKNIRTCKLQAQSTINTHLTCNNITVT